MEDGAGVALELTTKPEDAGKLVYSSGGIRSSHIIPSQISFNVEYNPENKEYPKFIHNKVLFGKTVKFVYEISLEISSEWLLQLSHLRLAFAMLLNERLGENSPIDIFYVTLDIINKIGENILEIVGDKPLKVDLQNVDIIEDHFKNGGGKKKKIKSKKKKIKSKKKRKIKRKKSKRKKHKTKRRKS